MIVVYLRLVAIVAVATVALVAGASARNKMRDASAEPAYTGTIRAASPEIRRMTQTASVVVQHFQHDPDRSAELVGQGFVAVAKGRD